MVRISDCGFGIADWSQHSQSAFRNPQSAMRGRRMRLPVACKSTEACQRREFNDSVNFSESGPRSPDDNPEQLLIQGGITGSCCARDHDLSGGQNVCWTAPPEGSTMFIPATPRLGPFTRRALHWHLSLGGLPLLSRRKGEWRPAGVLVRRTCNPRRASYNPRGNCRTVSNRAIQRQIDEDDQSASPEEKPKKVAAPQEPRSFQPPANAQKICAARLRDEYCEATGQLQTRPQPQRQYAAGYVAKAPMRCFASSTGIDAAAHGTHESASRAATAAAVHQRVTQAKRSRMRKATTRPTVCGTRSMLRSKVTRRRNHRINRWSSAGRGRGLPMPSSKPGMQQPVMRSFDGPGAFVGPYQPYGESGGGWYDNGGPAVATVATTGAAIPAVAVVLRRSRLRLRTRLWL